MQRQGRSPCQCPEGRLIQRETPHCSAKDVERVIADLRRDLGRALRRLGHVRVLHMELLVLLLLRL